MKLQKKESKMLKTLQQIRDSYKAELEVLEPYGTEIRKKRRTDIENILILVDEVENMNNALARNQSVSADF